MTPRLTLILAAATLLVGAGCGRKSESEKLGDKIDRKVENVEDAVTNDGPAENAREAKDNAKDEIKDRTD